MRGGVTTRSGVRRGNYRVLSPLKIFDGASSFNQPLNDWNVSNVEDMEQMFKNATSFNQPLNNWDVSNVTDMRRMFEEASSFRDAGRNGGTNSRPVTHASSGA